MIGHLRSVVFDCPNPRALASFYGELLGGTVTTDEDDGNWVTITDEHGTRVSFQRSPEHQPPRFPDPAASQQLHLDIQVDDVDLAEQKVLALGATRIRNDGERGSGFRVFADPAGHPFCLVWGV